MMARAPRSLIPSLALRNAAPSRARFAQENDLPIYNTSLRCNLRSSTLNELGASCAVACTRALIAIPQASANSQIPIAR